MDDIAVEDWVTEDNSIVQVTKRDLLGITGHIMTRNGQEVILARKRKDDMLSKKNLKEIENFDINKVYEQ